MKNKILKLITNRIKSDYFKVFSFDMVAKVTTVIISILVIRILSEVDYASLTVFNSLGSFISCVLGSGLGLAYTKYAVLLRKEDLGSDAILFSLLRKIVLYVSLFLLVVSSVFYFSDKIDIVYYSGFVYGLFIALYQLNVVFFQAREKYSTAGIVSNIKNFTVGFAILAIFIITSKANIIQIIVLYISAVLLSWICTTIYINRNIYNDISKHKDSDSSFFLKTMFTEGFWIILYMFVLSAFNQLDVLLLNHFRPASDVAQYGVAYKYYSTVLSLLPALQVVNNVRNTDNELIKHPEQIYRLVFNWVKKTTPYALGLYIVGCMGAHFLFPILNGNNYNGSIIVFDILLIGASLSYITAPNINLMFTAGKQKVLFILSLGSFLINFLGNILLIPKYGSCAAAITTVLAHFFLNGGSTLILIMYERKKS